MRKTVDDEIMKLYAELIKSVLPSEYGFTLLCYRLKDENAVAHYISDSNRADIVIVLKKMIAQLENKKSLN